LQKILALIGRTVHNTLVKLIALLVSGTLTLAQAAGPSLGVAIAKGGFRVDGSPVTGNATLFDGSTIETAQASSRLQFTSGARIELAPGSRAKVFGDHLSLEKGSGELASNDFQIEARTLRIETAGARSVARVKMSGEKSVLVAAAFGPVRVYNDAGFLVANVIPGMSLAFEPQAAAPAASERTGCLYRSREDSTKYILVDRVANVTVELRGQGLAEQVGNQVKIAGTSFRSAAPVAGASQVLQVNSIELVTRGGCGTAPAAPAAPAASGTAAPAPGGPVATSGGGLSNGAKVAIVAAVAGGGAAGVIAATQGNKSR
jgi:hypothetical protein